MRGYLYTLEVLIAFSIMSIILISIYKIPETQPELDISLIKQQGYNALKYLDESGDLKKIMASNDEITLENELSKLISKSIEFETEICRNRCDERNVPKNRTIIVVDYYSSGYRFYDNKKVRLWLWRKI